MTSTNSHGVAVAEVRDFYGRSYRVGERPHDIMGRSRKWMLWLPLVAMAGISVLQYGYSIAATALTGTDVTAAFWVLALWVMFQAGSAALTAVLRYHSAVAPAHAMLVGAVLCAAGPLTLAYTDNFGLVVLGFSALCGTGAGIVYATCSSTVAQWYPEARGARIGAVTGAFGYGAVPFIIVFAAGLSPTNHTEVFAVVGVVVLAVVALCGLFFRDPPLGWWPTDVDPRLWALDKRINRSLRSNAPAARQYDPGQAVQTTAFVVMYLIMVFAAATFLMAVAYIPIMAISNGFSMLVAALSIGLLAVVSGAGRAVANNVSDRFGRRQTLTAALLLAGGAQLGLVYSASLHQAAAFVVFAALSGLAGGSCYPVLASMVADYFGERNAVRNFGLVYSAKLFGGLIGIGLPASLASSPALMGVFTAAGLIGLCAAITTRLLQQPGHLISRLPR